MTTRKPKPPFFEDLDPHIQEVVIELISSIVREKRKKENQDSSPQSD